MSIVVPHRTQHSELSLESPGRDCQELVANRETELYCFAEFVVERLADYVDTGTTIFDIVTRYPLSPKNV